MVLSDCSSASSDAAGAIDTAIAFDERLDWNSTHTYDRVFDKEAGLNQIAACYRSIYEYLRDACSQSRNLEIF